MTEVWTGRKSQWRPDISGFDSLDNMRSWCAAAVKGDPDLFEPLFMPSEQGHLVRFNCLSADIEWKSIDELPMSEKKALRWDYHQWRARVTDNIKLERRPIGFVVSESPGPANSTLFDPAHVKLFSGRKEDGDQVWGMVWGMNLDNEKENFLPPYASRELSQAPGVEDDRKTIDDTDLSEAKFQSPKQEFVEETKRNEPGVSELDHNLQRNNDFKVWFLRNRSWISAVSFGTLILGVLRMILWP